MKGVDLVASGTLVQISIKHGNVAPLVQESPLTNNVAQGHNDISLQKLEDDQTELLDGNATRQHSKVPQVPASQKTNESPPIMDSVNSVVRIWLPCVWIVCQLLLV